jgi:hypothetical protein
MEERWTSPTFTDTLKKMRMEAEISSKALQGTYDMDYGSWADGIEEVENGTNDLTDALKRAREEQEKWEHESAIKAIQYAEEARAEAWQQEIEMMNAMVATSKRQNRRRRKGPERSGTC